jgi:hypothetical protein
MSELEPVDERAADPVEIRGGDRPEDYIAPFAGGGLIPRDDQIGLLPDEDAE